MKAQDVGKAAVAFFNTPLEDLLKDQAPFPIEQLQTYQETTVVCVFQPEEVRYYSHEDNIIKMVLKADSQKQQFLMPYDDIVSVNVDYKDTNHCGGGSVRWDEDVDECETAWERHIRKDGDLWIWLEVRG